MVPPVGDCEHPRKSLRAAHHRDDMPLVSRLVIEYLRCRCRTSQMALST